MKSSKERQAKRRSKLNHIAQAAGWAGWSQYETAVINGKVKLPDNPDKPDTPRPS